MDVVKALSKQMSNMGYVLVLTFICYNFLALLTYSNLGNYITYLGAKALENLGLSNYPILLLIGLLKSISSSISLLNNLEIVATSLIALLFKEKINIKLWIEIILITI